MSEIKETFSVRAAYASKYATLLCSPASGQSCHYHVARQTDRAHTQNIELLYLGARLRKYKTQLRLTSAVRTKWIGVGSQACLRARAEIGRRRPLPLDDCEVGHLEGVCQLAATLYKPGQAIAHVVVLHGDVRCQIQFELIIVSQL